MAEIQNNGYLIGGSTHIFERPDYDRPQAPISRLAFEAFVTTPPTPREPLSFRNFYKINSVNKRIDSENQRLHSENLKIQFQSDYALLESQMKLIREISLLTIDFTDTKIKESVCEVSEISFVLKSLEELAVSVINFAEKYENIEELKEIIQLRREQIFNHLYFQDEIQKFKTQFEEGLIKRNSQVQVLLVLTRVLENFAVYISDDSNHHVFNKNN